MNTPHVRPRASEFFTVVAGEVDFGYILENGLVSSDKSQEVTGHLSAFDGTVFPMGSIHYQLNTGCDEAVFVSSFNSNDPGTSQVAQNFFGLNLNAVNATLGYPSTMDGRDLDTFRHALPANIALGIDSCLKKCNIQKR